MIKTSCLVLFRLAQSCIIYVKLEEDDAEINIASRPSLIDRSLGSINRKLGRMCFSVEFQLSHSSLKRLGFYVFTLGI